MNFMKKILFLTTAHKHNDDRIFYHQAKALKDEGFEVKICSLSSEYSGNIEGIEIESFSVLHESISYKIKVFNKICTAFVPDCIICSEPLAVIATKQYRKNKKISIVYDITEWYPALRMLQPYAPFGKLLHGIKFFLIQLYAGFCSTHFIFGERTKKYPLAFFFPFKKSLVLPYYPDDSYIDKNINKLQKNKITLCYTGRISREDGIENFFNAANALRRMKPHFCVQILIVGAPKRKEDQEYFSNLLSIYKWENITIKEPVKFELFSKSCAEADICFDLRESNIEYNYCLPIKLFYYIASGKPVIYTNLKAIKKHMDISKFGYAVQPEDSEGIAKLIVKYTENPDLYDLHAHNARKEFEQKYNWKSIRESLVTYIQQSIKKGD